MLPLIALAKPPGLYHSFKQFISIEKDNYLKKLERLEKSPDPLTTLKDFSSLDFDPDFINHILFYTPTRYALLAQKDRCSFYDLVLADLIRDHEGPIQYFIVRYQLNKKKARRSYVTKDVFMQMVASKECPKVFAFKNYFSKKLFKKTIQTVQLKTPTTMENCFKTHQDFIKDYKTPHLCGLHKKIDNLSKLQLELNNTPSNKLKEITELKQKIKLFNFYKQNISENGFYLLGKLCSNLDRPHYYCKEFFQQDFWTKVIKKEKSSFYLNSLCKSILNRENLSESSLKVCQNKMNSNPEECRFANQYASAITPKPNCNNIAKALNYSKLFSDYEDCPSKVGNYSVSNIGRILKHFKMNKMQKSSLCSLDISHEFLTFNMENDGRAWEVSLCYDDKINEKEVCLATLMGSIENSSYSIERNVENILKRTKAAENSLKCELIKQSEYNPVMLKFISGCWITYEPQNCSATDCQIKIIYNRKEMTHIKFKNKLEFDYFANDFKTAKFSQFSLLENGLQKKHKKILNITALKSVLENNSKAILHGMGCAEDILPSYFKKYAFNQCSPLAFIIDGIIEENGMLSLVTRTALDGLHAPRIISWTRIFSAIKTYQMQHPLQLWGLYAIY